MIGNEKKEPDFAVYYKGKFAILDIASKYYHTGIDSDIDRRNWFMNHNINVKQEKASDCYNDPIGVVDRFLKWMEGL